MKDSTGKCSKKALVTSDWLVRCEDGPQGNSREEQQQRRFTFSKEQIMKRFFQILKTQEVALTVALVWMVVWAGVAMTEAFNHIA